MYNNKIVKLIIIMLIIFVTLLSLNTKVFAAPPSQGGGGGSDWDPTKNPSLYEPGQGPAEPELEKKAGVILGIINIIGVIVSVVTLMVIGIKYMIGSVEEKAEYKKTMMMYLIGAALVFSVTTIPNILYMIGSSI